MKPLDLDAWGHHKVERVVVILSINIASRTRCDSCKYEIRSMSMKACDNVNCTKILLTISNLREEKHNQPYSKLQTLRYPDSVLAFT